MFSYKVYKLKIVILTFLVQITLLYKNDAIINILILIVLKIYKLGIINLKMLK